jgi:hydrogenase maturation protease
VSRAVVLGIGNVLLSDEGIGVHAVTALVEQYDLGKDVDVVDGGTTGMELLPDLEGADELVVIDAIRAGQPPASVIRLEGDEVPSFFKTKLSPHQVGLSDILAALAFKGFAPGHIVLIGVQPVTLALGMNLSPEVNARLGDVLSLVAGELKACGHVASLRT